MVTSKLLISLVLNKRGSDKKMKKSNLDLKFLMAKSGINQRKLSHFLNKSYSWIQDQFRFEMPKDKKNFFKKAIHEMVQNHRNNGDDVHSDNE